MGLQEEQKTKIEIVEEISSTKSEPQWLLEKRKHALANFISLPNPNTVYGLGISLGLEADLESINFPTSSKSITVTRGNKGLIVSDLHAALKTHGSMVKSRLFSTLSESNKFHALHQSFFTRGLFIYVPKNTEAKLPVHSVFSLDSNTIEHVLIILEPFSKLTFLETGSQSEYSKPIYRSQIVEVFAGEGSSMDFGCMQNFSQNVFNFSERRSVLEKDATINWNICDIGSKVAMSYVTNLLVGEGSTAKNIGIFFGRESQQFDFSINAIHMAPNTTCDMLTKGALDGHAKAIYRGLIKITPEAPKSEGYQKADILLLSSDAEADPMPNLEINNNDIKKCTHGATVGQVDREKIFYMMSRGLTEADAKKKIVEGLFELAVSRIPIESVQNRLREILGSIMPGEGKTN